jgi:hypothetical protein
MAAQHQAAAGVAVEPVRKGGRMREAEAQAVELLLKVGTAAGAGVHRDACRLVDDQDQPVTIQYAVGESPPEDAPHPPAHAGPSLSPPCAERAGVRGKLGL